MTLQNSLAKVAALALAGIPLVFMYLMTAVFHRVMTHMVLISAAALVFSVLLMTERRWTPALGPVFVVVMLVLEGGPRNAIAALTNPQHVTFVPVVVSMALSTIAATAGTFVLAQNYGWALSTNTRWLENLLVGVGACSVGAISVALAL